MGQQLWKPPPKQWKRARLPKVNSDAEAGKKDAPPAQGAATTKAASPAAKGTAGSLNTLLDNMKKVSEVAKKKEATWLTQADLKQKTIGEVGMEKRRWEKECSVLWGQVRNLRLQVDLIDK